MLLNPNNPNKDDDYEDMPLLVDDIDDIDDTNDLPPLVDDHVPMGSGSPSMRPLLPPSFDAHDKKVKQKKDDDISDDDFMNMSFPSPDDDDFIPQPLSPLSPTMPTAEVIPTWKLHFVDDNKKDSGTYVQDMLRSDATFQELLLWILHPTGDKKDYDSTAVHIIKIFFENIMYSRNNHERLLKFLLLLSSQEKPKLIDQLYNYLIDTAILDKNDDERLNRSVFLGRMFCLNLIGHKQLYFHLMALLNSFSQKKIPIAVERILLVLTTIYKFYFDLEIDVPKNDAYYVYTNAEREVQYDMLIDFVRTVRQTCFRDQKMEIPAIIKQIVMKRSDYLRSTKHILCVPPMHLPVKLQLSSTKPPRKATSGDRRFLMSLFDSYTNQRSCLRHRQTSTDTMNEHKSDMISAARSVLIFLGAFKNEKNKSGSKKKSEEERIYNAEYTKRTCAASYGLFFDELDPISASVCRLRQLAIMPVSLKGTYYGQLTLLKSISGPEGVWPLVAQLRPDLRTKIPALMAANANALSYLPDIKDFKRPTFEMWMEKCANPKCLQANQVAGVICRFCKVSLYCSIACYTKDVENHLAHACAKNKFESTMSVEMNGIINNCHMLTVSRLETSVDNHNNKSKKKQNNIKTAPTTTNKIEDIRSITCSSASVFTFTSGLPNRFLDLYNQIKMGSHLLSMNDFLDSVWSLNFKNPVSEFPQKLWLCEYVSLMCVRTFLYSNVKPKHTVVHQHVKNNYTTGDEFHKPPDEKQNLSSNYREHLEKNTKGHHVHSDSILFDSGDQGRCLNDGVCQTEFSSRHELKLCPECGIRNYCEDCYSSCHAGHRECLVIKAILTQALNEHVTYRYGPSHGP